MKKILLAAFLLLFVLPVLADDSNWGISSYPQVKPSQQEQSEKVWNNENDELMYDNYGSANSPGFLNRGNVDPRGSISEDNYDYEDDDIYNYDAGGN